MVVLEMFEEEIKELIYPLENSSIFHMMVFCLQKSIIHNLCLILAILLVREI